MNEREFVPEAATYQQMQETNTHAVSGIRTRHFSIKRLQNYALERTASEIDNIHTHTHTHTHMHIDYFETESSSRNWRSTAVSW